jgi:hypothetical protein
MTLLKTIAIAAAPVAVLLLAVPGFAPAWAQSDKGSATAPKMQANFAAPTASARPRTPPSAAVRPVSTVQTTDGESSAGQAAPAGANQASKQK